MATLLKWPRHVPVEHESYAGCSVCGAWEGEIPTDCPGEEMTDDQREAVLHGRLDYIWREGWTTVTRYQRLRNKVWCEEGRII